ncbi:glycosyltransferase family 2 protein [uncultured Pseudoflavonifractor sp.]|uniref:glycosyltransferase family 2 protein n=1 Tax=uncultured Pseudoflavonifractor sp. TaxID=1221379 RepID=UPI0025E34620|nr:glycosyltransferase family 2 protein [uncultured Pseudoflavonifractor sp.]
MNMIHLIENLNFFIAVLFTVLYFYQLIYLGVGLVRRKHPPRLPENCKLHRYAAVISARNEEGVIAELIQCLKNQNYPSELLDVYVVADNCTDDTVGAARRAGAIVYERQDQRLKGKGYALDWLFHRLAAERRDVYDAYLIFDADNLVDKEFVREMNRVFDTGKYDALTCYRNSKNFGANWISAGYSIWFLREARFLSYPRMLLGGNCHVSGTGFLVSSRVIRENGGWPYHLLTEDIEFSVSSAVKGFRIGYCDAAVVYDEQPTTFRQSWDQRLRWSKGFYQVDKKYALPLLKGCARLNKTSWSCYDMLMTVAPGMLLTLVLFLFNAIMCAVCLVEPPYIARYVMSLCLEFMGSSLFTFYMGLLVYGIITVLSEWKHINAPAGKKLFYVFLFPVFMFTYIPISLAALVSRVEWKPIYHSSTKQLSTVR